MIFGDQRVFGAGKRKDGTEQVHLPEKSRIAWQNETDKEEKKGIYRLKL